MGNPRLISLIFLIDNLGNFWSSIILIPIFKRPDWTQPLTVKRSLDVLGTLNSYSCSAVDFLRDLNYVLQIPDTKKQSSPVAKFTPQGHSAPTWICTRIPWRHCEKGSWALLPHCPVPDLWIWSGVKICISNVPKWSKGWHLWFRNRT